MKTTTIARDDNLYHAWPDVARLADGRLVCVFSECNHHNDRSYARIMCCTSNDDGASWTPKRPVTVASRGKTSEVPYWNCPRVVALDDGRLVVIVDQPVNDGAGEHRRNYLIWSDDRGETWGEPQPIPVQGIVPDRLIVLRHGPHAGRWLISAHGRNPGNGPRCAQRLWYSDDQGASWSDAVTVAAHRLYWLCEGSICELPGGELVCFLRENSGQGLDAMKTISRDGGETWSHPIPFPLPGCHRPVAGVLSDGTVLITHRYMQGGKGWIGWWTQNTFAALSDVESCLAPDRDGAHTRIVPITFDRSPVSDCGYTGWVELPDGSIFIVDYCVDDAPKAQIRGYRLERSDILLEQPQTALAGAS